MTREELEMVPELVYSGRFTWEQAVREMIVFIIQNKGLFVLYKYDEDFISDLVIEFLDRGPGALSQYNPKQGNFFSFTFCFVKNICNSIIKQQSVHSVIDYHSISESILNYEEKCESYQNIKFAEFERPKVPFNYKPVSYKDFQIACQTDTYRFQSLIDYDKSELPEKTKEKLKEFSPRIIHNMIIVVALKASYYLTEDYIRNITQMFNIDYETFHSILLKIKSEIQDREKHRKILEIRRNKAYFQHKRIRDEIVYTKQLLEDESFESESLNKRYNKNTSKWNTLNHQMEDGKIVIRPTTKLIAKVLGLSTRQVTYYQSLARQIGLSIDRDLTQYKKAD